jgi:hypothetical protein
MDRVRNFALVHQAIKDDAESCLLRDKEHGTLQTRDTHIEVKMGKAL